MSHQPTGFQTIMEGRGELAELPAGGNRARNVESTIASVNARPEAGFAVGDQASGGSVNNERETVVFGGAGFAPLLDGESVVVDLSWQVDAGDQGEGEPDFQFESATVTVLGMTGNEGPEPLPPEPPLSRTLTTEASGNDFIDGVLDGSKWNPDPVAGPVTFSFPNSLDDYAENERGIFLHPKTGTSLFMQASAEQADALRFFASSVREFTNLDLRAITNPALDAGAVSNDVGIAGGAVSRGLRLTG